MIENKEYFEKHKYRKPTDYVVEAFVAPKLKFIQECGCFGGKKARILDVGSGNGTFSWHLSKYADVTCIDYSSQLLNDNECMSKVRGSAYQLPFSNGLFDIVFEANMLHHLDHPQSVIEEMARCSSKYIIVIEPNRYNPLMFLFSWMVASEKGVRVSFKKRWVDTLAKAGFDITGCIVTGMISQQNTPRIFIPFLRLFDFNFWLGEYVVVVGEKRDDKCP